MGRRGPRPLSMEVLERRGSWLAKQRNRKAAEATETAATKALPPAAVAPELSDARLRAVIRKIPGYDSRRDAGKEYVFDCDKARKAINFIQRRLHHVKGAMAGKPFLLEPWEQAIIANIFGWVCKKTGFRRYREVFIECPRKQGKSSLCAAVILYLLLEDGEPGAEIYGAAFKFDQAALVWTQAAGMLRGDAGLRAKVKVFKGQAKSLEVGQPGDLDYATYRVISSDSLGSHGFNIHGVIVDELHAFQNGDLVDTLTTGTGSRRQPLVVYITTADYERLSICNEKESYAKSVQAGTLTDASFLPVLYIAPIDADWHDRKVWRACNPNLGISISLEALEKEHQTAVEVPRYEGVFKRLHLCQKVAVETRWLSLDSWKTCVATPGDPAKQFSEEALRGRSCTAGMDLSSTSDITATCVLFGPKGPDDPYLATWKFYIPAANVEPRVRRDKVPYDLWGRQGFITLTPGNVIDYAYVRRDLETLCERHNVTRVLFDRCGFEALRQQMIAGGLPEKLFVSFGQGYFSISPAMKALERLILAKKLLFQDNPVVLWMARNVAVATDPAGNIKTSKQASGEKIDGIVSLIMALGGVVGTPAQLGSVYESRGIRVIGGEQDE
jgi:phage terminase large subunit-like protein